mmetsp:Transcript_823/g.1579  ORF Transcript_823/g.1579 Transcript_823/m.1579 type:complete len:457 (-) Transcript_823:53-1423(-)
MENTLTRLEDVASDEEDAARERLATPSASQRQQEDTPTSSIATVASTLGHEKEATETKPEQVPDEEPDGDKEATMEPDKEATLEPKPENEGISPADATVIIDDGTDGTKEAESWAGVGNRPKEEPVLSLVSLNSKTAPSFDLVRGSMAVLSELPSSVSSQARTVRVSCGRDASNTIVLADSRVSSIHFSLRVKAARGGLVALELQDQSSNGTWVNGRRIGKGRRVQLNVGDKVIVLPSSQVGHEAEAGYLLLHDVRGARCAGAQLLGASGRFDETAALTLKPGEFCEAPLLSRVLEPELQCHICVEALYNCLTVVPCGHNFCGPCLLRWRRSSSQCPECRTQIQQAVRNYAVDKVVESFRQAHPEASRTDADFKRLEALDSDPEHRAMMKWLLKEGPWAEVNAVPTPARQGQGQEQRASAQRVRRLAARQNRERQYAAARQESRREQDSSSICVIS